MGRGWRSAPWRKVRRDRAVRRTDPGSAASGGETTPGQDIRGRNVARFEGEGVSGARGAMRPARRGRENGSEGGVMAQPNSPSQDGFLRLTICFIMGYTAISLAIVVASMYSANQEITLVKLLYVTPTLLAYATITAPPAILAWKLLESRIGVLVVVFVYKIALYALILGIGGAPDYASQGGVVTFSGGRITPYGMSIKAAFALSSALVAVVAIAICDIWRKRRVSAASCAQDSK